MDNLPDSYAVDLGRMNKWAAASYLGKTYLYEKKYQEAKAVFDQVIGQGTNSKGQKYDLVANYHDNFDAATENNSESVFVVQMVANAGTNDVSNSNGGDLLNYPVTIFPCCGIFIPSQDFVNSFRTDANGLPYIDTYNQHAVKSDQGLISDQAFTPDAGPLDPRLDWSVGRRGIPYLDWGVHQGKAWIRDQAEAGQRILLLAQPRLEILAQVEEFHDRRRNTPDRRQDQLPHERDDHEAQDRRDEDRRAVEALEP